MHSTGTPLAAYCQLIFAGAIYDEMDDTYGVCDAARRMLGHVRQRLWIGQRRDFKWHIERRFEQTIGVTRRIVHG
jgi:hypothetical protein